MTSPPKETPRLDRRTAEWDLAAGADNYAALVIGQIAGALLSFGALSIVSRALEPTGYGGVVAILALSQAVGQVALHWSVFSLYRHGCEEFVATGRIAASFWTRLAILAASGAAVAATSPFWFAPFLAWLGIPREASWLVPIHVASSALSIHVHYALLAAKQPRFQSLALVVSRAALVLLLLLGAGFERLSWTSVAVLYALSPLFEALFGLLRLRPLIHPGISLDRPLFRTMIGFSLPLTINGILGYLSTSSLDAFFILKLLSTRELGLYSLAYQIVGTFMQMATLAGSLLLSLFVTLGLEGRSERTGNYFRELLPVLCLLWSGACLALSAAGSVAIPLFFGPSFEESAALLWPLGAAAALAGPVFLGFGPLIHARSVTHISAYLATASAAVNVLLNAVLIPRFGLAGCAWATAAAYGTGTVVAFALSRKLVDVKLRWHLLPAAPAVAAAVVVASGSGPVLGTAAGGLTLFALVLAERPRVERSLVRLTRFAVARPANAVSGGPNG